MKIHAELDALALHNAQVMERFRMTFKMLHLFTPEERAELLDLVSVAKEVSTRVNGTEAPGLAELGAYVEALQKKDAN